MKTIIYTVALLFAVTLPLLAQDEITLVTGETITGEIQILMPDEYYEEISFDSGDDKQRYRAHQFTTFTADGKEYRTVKFAEKYRIMEVVKDGYLSLLKFRSDESYSFNADFLHKMDGEGSEVPSFLFKKSMSNFLGDCDPIRRDIDAGNYRRRDLEQLIDDYNSCMADQTDYRITEQKKEVAREKSSTLIEEIEGLSNQASAAEDEELVNMLNDVLDKVKGGEQVPNYLKNALTDHVTGDHALKDAVEAMIARL